MLQRSTDKCSCAKSKSPEVDLGSTADPDVCRVRNTVGGLLGSDVTSAALTPDLLETCTHVKSSVAEWWDGPPRALSLSIGKMSFQT